MASETPTLTVNALTVNALTVNALTVKRSKRTQDTEGIAMKLITAIVKPFKLDDVKSALRELACRA